MEIKSLLDSVETSLDKITEAFEGQNPRDFPYPVDTEDKQGEIEFWPEGGSDTADFIELIADNLTEGEGGSLRYILDAGLETVGRVEDEKNALSIMQDKAMELMKEYYTDIDTDQPSTEKYYKRVSDYDFKVALIDAIYNLREWIDNLEEKE